MRIRHPSRYRASKILMIRRYHHVSSCSSKIKVIGGLSLSDGPACFSQCMYSSDHIRPRDYRDCRQVCWVPNILEIIIILRATFRSFQVCILKGRAFEIHRMVIEFHFEYECNPCLMGAMPNSKWLHQTTAGAKP